MEYVDGKSLKDILNQVKFIPQEIALGIVLEIGKGLGYAHQKGIVHRDIKPANILIGYDGIVKIADFGLAQAQDLTTITVTGAIVGTPAYMSPEQAAGKKVDNRSDIFSLGVVFYEMLTGVKPFKGENYSSVIHEILTINPIKAFEANPLIAKELSTVIERMLEKDPDKRYQNIEEVSEDIIIQMKRTRTEINRKDIGDFISKPEEKLKNLIEKRKERHFERGIYFMNSGYEKIDDAIAEFEKVLLLDPNDARAKNYLETLKTKRAKIPSQKKIKEKKPAKKSPIFIGMLAGLIAIAIIIYFILNSFFRVTPSKELIGMAVVNTVPPGAEIFFDNDSTGMITPATLKGLTIGEHQLELKKNGYKPFVQKIEIKGNDTLKLDITLLTEIAKEDTANIIKPPVPKKQSPPIQGMGYLKVKVEPWARIYIDGKYVETTPIARSLPVSSGVHSVRLENPNYKVWQKNLRFNPGDTLNLNVRLELLEGALKLIVRPWADVYIDGKFYETTPIAQPIKLSAGEHRLKLINPLYKPYEEVIVIKPSQVLKKDVELEKK